MCLYLMVCVWGYVTDCYKTLTTTHENKESYLCVRPSSTCVPACMQDIERTQKLLELTKTSEFEVSIKLAQAEEAALKMEGEMAAARQRQAQLEGLVRSKDKELEKLAKQIEAVRREEYEVVAEKMVTEVGLEGVTAGTTLCVCVCVCARACARECTCTHMCSS